MSSDKISALAALKARRQQAAAAGVGPNAAGNSATAADRAATGANSAAVTAAAVAAAVASNVTPNATAAAAGPGPCSAAPAHAPRAAPSSRPPAHSSSSTSSADASASASAIPSGSSGLGASAASRSGGAASTSSSGLSSAGGPPRPPPPAAGDDQPLPTRTVEAFAWMCGMCERECVPVRSESRCLCGHRLREHGPASAAAPSRCRAAKCGCAGFFYVVAEGSWVLRCRCKHKHTEHNAAHPTRGCAKPGCGCGAFDSPWVCNCDHPWAAHRQIVTNKQVVAMRDLLGGLSLAEAPGPAGAGGGGGGGGPAAEVNDYDGLKRGQLGPEAFGHM